MTNQSHSFIERRKRRAIIGSVAAVIAIVSWAYIFNRVSFLPSLAITDVRVYGAGPDISPRISSAAFMAISGSYAGLFSKSNAFIYPKGAIAAAAKHSSPRIADVIVKRDGLHSLTIAVSEKAPSAITCSGLPDFDDSGTLVKDEAKRDDCFFTDESGYIFMRASGSDLTSYTIYYVPALPDDPTGLQATSTEKFKALQDFLKGVKANGMEPQGLLIKEGGEYEMYISNHGGTAIVYFNDAASLEKELANLSAFWGKNKRSSFEYIDVRYGSNVFYRLIQ
jgi:hypothetical protein